jgi:TolB-like protein/F0F1-type ATP synthase membrane subunit c/vacuolar-type H+-ATPase subunit K
MKKIPGPMIPFLAALLVAAAIPNADAARRTTRVALIPLSSTGKGASRVAWRATTSMAKQLRRNRRVRVVVLAQRRAQRLAECLQVTHCIRSVSEKLRVRYLVAGHVTKMSRRSFRVDLRVVRGADGEVVSSDAFTTRTGKGSHSGRLALRLVRKAGQVRVAAASTRATDVPLRGAPLFSRSEAASAAYTPEGKDVENPLTPEEEKAEPEEMKTATAVDGAPASASPAATPTIQKETSFGTKIFSKRYTHAWATFSAGVAALGAGVAFGVISKNANQAALDAEYQKEAWLSHDKAQKNALVANILYGVGGAAVLTSAVMFYLEHRKEVREHRNEDLNIDLQVAQGGGGLTVSGSF